jgi:predicted CXXCH cytochrome family protein
MRTGSRAMKKLLFIGMGSALIVTMGGVGSAQADNGPHRSSAAAASSTNNAVTAINGAGRCASCHRAHTAKAEKLLKQAQPQLCYSCHDGTLAQTNVIDGNDGATGLRGGGFANARIGSAAATKDMGALDTTTGRIATLNQQIPVLGVGAATTSKHQIDGVTAGTAWGNGTDVASATNVGGLGKSLTLECGSCHDPHGNGNYRVLRPIPVDANNVVTAAIKVGDLVNGVPATVAVPAVMSIATGVNIPDATAKVYTTTNYWLSGDLNVPAGGTALTGTAVTTTPGVGDGYVQNVAAWCTTCHTRYLAGSGSYKTALAGTSTVNGVANIDANYTYRHRSNANYKAGAANCITCHFSHGSNASAGGGLNPGDSTPTTGDSRLLRVDNRGTCSMCHNV